MPYLMPYPSWHIHNYKHAIYPMSCLPCQTISVVPYYPIPRLTCHLSYHLPHGIYIITNMLYLPCHISHVISYIPWHILPCYFSHVIYRIIYLLFHIFCDTYLVPYVPVLLLRYCLSCAIISCAIYHVIYHWCHIYDAIYACIPTLLSVNILEKLPVLKSLRTHVSCTEDLPVVLPHLVFPPSLTLMDYW
jgi:hypothetical protein